MKSILPRILLLTLFASTGLLMQAQDKTPIAPIEYLRPMKNSFSIGVRMIGGANVTFSGALGATSYTAQEWYDYHRGNGSNPYNDGAHGADSLGDVTGGRIKEDPTLTVTAAVVRDLGGNGIDGRFYTILMNGSEPVLVDGKVVITGDYVAYDDSYTRNWSYSGASQLRMSDPGSGIYDQVAMSAYSSMGAQGATATAKSSNTPGIELTMGRVIQRHKRFEWGFTVGLGISEFNAKTRQSLPVRLQYVRDIYDIYSTGANFDQTPAKGALGDLTVISQPTFNASGTGAGGLTYQNPNAEDPTAEINGTRETTNPISAERVGEQQTGDDATGTVNGFWQVKGVYYMLRVGPMARIPIGKRFSAYLSAGYMAAYAGSKFRYDENVILPDNTGTISTKVTNSSGNVIDTKENQQYLSGFYADCNLEWWLSTRTGFYAGVAYERLGSYDQKFNGRKASVKMDNGLGLRFGVMTRF